MSDRDLMIRYKMALEAIKASSESSKWEYRKIAIAALGSTA